MKREGIFSFCLLLCCYSSYAVALNKDVSVPDFAIVPLIGSFLLVISCIFVFAYLVKKTNLMKNSHNHHLKIVSTYPLTNKGRLQIIECNGQQYLLGVTEQNITLLDKFDVSVMDLSENSEQVTGFSAILSKLNKKKNE
jgi:flagellar protein FliO/FliZ